MTPSVTPNFDEDTPSGETLSEVFHLLQAERRRRVVWYLVTLEPDKTVTVRELAKEIAADEQGIPPAVIPNEDYRPVYTNLVQHHLPTLEDANVVEFNADRKVVAPGANLVALVAVAGISIPALALFLTKEMSG